MKTTFLSTYGPMFSTKPAAAHTDTKMTSIGQTPGDKAVSSVIGCQGAGA